ncbi:hypothetical protein OIU91_17105 [Streptomyces sp. NBC_01456]|uniref:hypothetical protein n=1 Tax=Streptomyces sp. NBC_01456 TaxID=2975868 RepID=UPI002E3637C8|nr:hypothetical protein [Streptomyces sp. NBC_01456]
MFVVLELIFYSGWTAAGTLGAILVGGFYAVSCVGAEARPEKSAKPKRRHRKS